MASKRFLVMSDSHGDRGVVEALLAHYAGRVDAMFHNGDSELPASDPIWSGVQAVLGNCDYGGGFPDQLVTDLSELRIFQVHGHLQGINFGWDRLIYQALEADADICLYGHLHAAAAWQEEGIVFVNPGSVLQPRGPIQEKLYALVEVMATTIAVDFYDLSHQLYPALSREFLR